MGRTATLAHERTVSRRGAGLVTIFSFAAGDESLLLDPVTIFRPATIVTAALSDVQ